MWDGINLVSFFGAFTFKPSYLNSIYILSKDDLFTKSQSWARLGDRTITLQFVIAITISLDNETSFRDVFNLVL